MSETVNKVVLISKKGFKELKNAIKKLEKDREKQIKELKELDVIENHDGRLSRIEKLAALEKINAELDEKTTALANVKLYPRKRDALKVAIGSVVELIDQKGRYVRYMLVDSIEANPSDGRISIDSPLGSSLVGKAPNDTVSWSAALGRVRKLQLVKIT